MNSNLTKAIVTFGLIGVIFTAGYFMFDNKVVVDNNIQTEKGGVTQNEYNIASESKPAIQEEVKTIEPVEKIDTVKAVAPSNTQSAERQTPPSRKSSAS